jgi:trimethylamine-N-oxide reductase (cytochrome c)
VAGKRKLVKKSQLTTGGPCWVYVDEEENKIVRVTPIDLTDEDAPSWKIEARGRTFSPPRKSTMTPVTAASKSYVHSDKRLLYPLKRIGFDPKGERNEELRGEPQPGGDPKYPGYERISWDEALNMVADEIKYCKRELGPGSVVVECSSHHTWALVNYRHSLLPRFMNTIGASMVDHNPDSWDGWHWGAVHTWGHSARLGIAEQTDGFVDCIQNCEMIVWWSSDPETTGGIYGAFESTVRRQWLQELGIKFVFIDPHYNHTNALYGGKWFSPRLGTDAALAAAIAYVWITEGTYDKEYVATHTHGFEEWTKYILGETDGVPKTPDWAAAECNLKAHDIRALAREWAKHRTMLAAGGKGGWGGCCRSPIGMDWSRMMIALIAMQGLGKPGVNLYTTTEGAPVDSAYYVPRYADGGIGGDPANSAAAFALAPRLFAHGTGNHPTPTNIVTAAGAHLDRLLLPESILDGYAEWSGRGFVGASIEQQFHRYHYPADGYAKMHLLYKYGGSQIGTMGATNRYVKMYRTKNLPMVVSQSIWFEGETKFADVILPACTNFERWDVSEWASNSGYNPDSHNQANHRFIVLQEQCIKPLGESMSDYHIFWEVCKRLGVGDVFSDGKDTLDWCEAIYNVSDMPKMMSWEDFKKKKYFIVPVDNKAPDAPPYRWFYENREQDTRGWISRIKPSDTLGLKGLQTQSGKIEFVSNSLKRFGHYDTDDKERPLMPMYLESWEGHHSERFKDYPLAVVSPHPRFSFHTMGDAKDSFLNDVKDHRVEVDGHYYWVFRMNEADAAERGIKDGDLIRAYNERGSVIFCCRITKRVPKGTCHCYESCAEYDPLGTPGESDDRGGCINLLTPSRLLSKYATGMTTEHCLVQVEKWNGR